MELKIDPQPSRQTWESFAVRLIPNDLVYLVVKYHAYMINNVFNINLLDNKSTSGNATKKGRRVYVCVTGKYIKHGTSDCHWKIILKKEIGHTMWSMKEITQTNCMYMHPFTSIDVYDANKSSGFSITSKKKCKVTNQ